jgi:hypothetical protein
MRYPRSDQGHRREGGFAERMLGGAITAILATVGLAACGNSDCPEGTTTVVLASGEVACQPVQVTEVPDCATALPGSELRTVGTTQVCVCPAGTGLLNNTQLGQPQSMSCQPVGLPVCEYADQQNCNPPPPDQPPPPPTCEEFPDQENCNQPPVLPPQAFEESCVQCHAPGGRGQAGIEDPHPWLFVKCTDCHGGDGTAVTQEAAHVPIPAAMANPQWPGRSNIQYYYNYLTTHGLENFGPEGLAFLKFVNPGDLRIAEQTCGKNSGCHADKVAAFQGSVILTSPGLLDASLYRAGVKRSINTGAGDRAARDATTGVTLGLDQIADAMFETHRGTTGGNNVQRLTYFTIGGSKTQNRDEIGTYTEEDVLKEIVLKQCGDCHAGGKGRNDRFADFRTGGCGSCHMPYALNGQSASQDPTIDRQEPVYPAAWANIAGFNSQNFNQYNDPVFIANFKPERPHPLRHQMTKTVSDKQCKPCHSGSNRTVDQYEGRQWDPNRVYVEGLNNATINANQVKFGTIIPQNDANARYHGQAFDQLIEYADLGSVMHTANDQPAVPDGINDISADVHKKAGLWCLDCHQSKEMHGTATLRDETAPWDAATNPYEPIIFNRMDAQVGIRCESCHGSIDYKATANSPNTPNNVTNLRVFTPQDVATMGQALGITEPGVYLALRSRPGQYRYVPQTKDTADPSSLAIKPGGQTPVYTINSFIAHGRTTAQTTASNTGPGVGPCKDGNFTRGNCVANGSELVPNGWSHLGSATTNINGQPLKANEQNANGLACYTCHATWQNNCYGCHLTLADNDGANVRYAGSPGSGALSIGFIQQGDFTWIASQEWTMGINSRGKISPQIPETKAFQRHVTRDNLQYNVVVLGAVNNAVQAATGYKTYRDRLGFGNVTNAFAANQGVQVGIKTVDLYGNTDPNGIPNFNVDARSDLNGGEGHQSFMPHSVQNKTQVRNCTSCHIDLNQNANQISYATAQVGVNPNGYAAADSGYITAFQNVTVTRNNVAQDVSLANGYFFDPNTDPDGGDGLARRLDYTVLYDGFPLVYSNHPMLNTASTPDPKYRRTYDPTASGPFTQELLRMWNPADAQKRVLVAPLNTNQ